QKKLIMLPSETMIWQPEFTDKTLSRKPGAVHVSISNEGADTYLFGPGIDDSVDLSRYSPELDSHGQYSLPASGKYELRVLQTRNDARKNKTKKYNVDIQIK
ncbi:PPC domain-containing protein, partial [Escherichia coli]|uniref:PPC domain-containing protein n=2 Tax=Escherichia coli TaxID=562 RepID=UPI001FCE5CF5